jgi:hypothetical protein
MFLLPLKPGSKFPLRDSYQRITDDPMVQASWIQEELNVGFLLQENGCAVLDYDEKEEARKFYAEHRELFNCISVTRRGAHFLFRGETRTRKMYADGKEIGDIKGNGYIVYPPSIVKGWQYHFVPGMELKEVSELKPFPEHLFTEVEKTRTLTREKVRKLDVYLSKIQSIAGKHGFGSATRAAAVCRDAGLSEAETTIKMLEWNRTPNVQPPWKPQEIARIVERVYRI